MTRNRSLRTGTAETAIVKNGANAVRPSKLLIRLGKVPDGVADGSKFLTSENQVTGHRQQATGQAKKRISIAKIGSKAARVLETRIFIG